MDQIKEILTEVSTNKKKRNILEYFWKWAGDKFRGCLVPLSFWFFLCQKRISIKGDDCKSPPGFEQEKVIQTQLSTIYGERNLRNAQIMRNTQIFLSQFLSNHQRVTE